MKILILGAGGVGGYFGAHLIRVGADVTFLVRAKRKALIDAKGLCVETPRGNFAVPAKTVTSEALTPDYDLIVLAPKSYDLDDAILSLENALGQAVILPFLNGLDHLDVLDARFGRQRVMGGVAHIAATLTDEGAIRQLTDMHSLTVGARHEAHEKLARAFMELCGQAPFDSVLADDIEQVLWDKWVFLAALAGMTTLCRGSVGEIMATPYGKRITKEMYRECGDVAGAFGHPVAQAARDKALGMLTAEGSPFTASMLRDLLSGQRTEHEHILGAMARRGEAQGLGMPLMRMAHTHMAVQAQKARA